MENQEIMSVQVVFPDGRTLDAVIAEIAAKLNSIAPAAESESAQA